jgi:hypothetical protein
MYPTVPGPRPDDQPTVVGRTAGSVPMLDLTGGLFDGVQEDARFEEGGI